MTDFTLRSVTGTISGGIDAGAGRDRVRRMPIGGLHPEAFEFVIQHFDCRSHLTQESLAQPGAITRSGKP